MYHNRFPSKNAVDDTNPFVMGFLVLTHKTHNECSRSRSYCLLSLQEYLMLLLKKFQFNPSQSVIWGYYLYLDCLVSVVVKKANLM